MVLPDDGRLRHRLVIDERALDLHRRESVAADFAHVVYAAEEPEVALLVALGAVAGEVPLPELRPVGLLVALGITVDAAEHPGPRRLEDEESRVHRFALLVHDVRL